MGSTEKELASRLWAVLQRLWDTGIWAKGDKCVFGACRIEFLGFVIDNKGIRPSDNKIQAIHNAPVPSTRQQLQAFLGLLNFYVFLKDMATLAEPLHRL